VTINRHCIAGPPAHPPRRRVRTDGTDVKDKGGTVSDAAR